MKRILVRAGFNPADDISVCDVVSKNLIRGNSGNMIFANSVMRALMVDDDVEIGVDYCRMSNLDAEWINEKYDCYVIPLADIFRLNGNVELERLTRLVKALKIPCIIVGAGVRAETYELMKTKREFDPYVKKLCDAVLEKSAIIGIRGELTGEYLTRFGYKEGKEFTVIGCPSMYTFGELKPFEKPVINSDSRISVNNSILSSPSTIEFLNGVLSDYKNSFFLPQRYEEMKAFYLGIDYIHRFDNKPEYPHKVNEGVYAENRVKMFASPNDWIDFLKTVDLSVGSRLHGNVTSIIAGTPSLFIPHGVRMRELIDYHKLPTVSGEEVAKTKNLEELIEKADFKSLFDVHHKNFEHYKEFLKTNGLETVFDRTYDGDVPYDKLLKKLDNKEIPSIVTLDKEATIERWAEYNQSKTDFKNQYLNRYVEEFRALNRTSFSSDIKDLILRILDKLKGIDCSNLERRGLNTHNEDFYKL